MFNIRAIKSYRLNVQPCGKKSSVYIEFLFNYKVRNFPFFFEDVHFEYSSYIQHANIQHDILQ